MIRRVIKENLTDFDILSYTDEMSKYFYERTKKHIDLVNKYAKKTNDKILIQKATKHDESKYHEPELIPYIWITWKYYSADNGLSFSQDQLLKDAMYKAVMHHVTHNEHHPEFWAKGKVNINAKDRDGIPNTITDVTQMPRIALAEMVCDWKAMGEEKGNSAKAWADKVIGTRWKFTNEQIDFIYELINKI